MQGKNIAYYIAYRASRSAVFERGFLAIYLTQIGIGEADLGLLMSIMFISVLLSEVPTGVFSDRVGRAISVSVGLILCAIYPFGMLYADGFLWVAVLFFILGCGRSFVSGSDHSLVYEYMQSQGLELTYPRIQAISSAVSAFVLGGSIICGGWLAGYSWTYLYLAFGIASVLSFFCWKLLERSLIAEQSARPAPRPEKPKPAAPQPTKGGLINFVFKSQAGLRYIGIVATISILCLALGPIFFYAQPKLLDAGLSLWQIGLVIGLIELVAGLPAWITSWVEDRFRYIEILSAYCLIGAVSLLLASFDTWAGIVMAVALVLWIGPIFNIASMHALHRVLPNANRTTLFSVASTIFSLATAAGFTVYGFLIEGFGWTTALYILLTLPILALVIGGAIALATQVKISTTALSDEATP